LRSWKVKRTSLAVSGFPSDHLAPFLMVKASVRAWFDHLNFEASHGVGAPLLSAFTNTSSS
jgi:hypothetical protein